MNRQIEIQYQKMISINALDSFWKDYAAKHKVFNNRERHNVIRKHSFSHIARTNTSVSLQGIARILDKTHATILHACRQHEANYMYDPDYRLVYDDMFNEMEEFLLVNGVVPKTIHPHVSEVEDVHFKFINVSRRLRDKIKEFDTYRKSIEVEVRKIEHMKSHSKYLQERVWKLEDDCRRMKNLL